MEERPSETESTDTRGDATREALLAAGLDLFARLGYHAASSRALAQAAGVNQALIGYHFGGKHGLYLAVFERIGERITARLGPVAGELETKLAVPGVDGASGGEASPDREALIEALLSLLDRAVDLFTSPETTAWAMLIVREQQNPSEAFDIVWERFMSRLAGSLCRIVAVLRDEPVDSPRLRLRVMTIIGQPLAFRVARETALRLLGREEIGEEEIATIKEIVRGNVLAMIG